MKKALVIVLVGAVLAAAVYGGYRVVKNEQAPQPSVTETQTQATETPDTTAATTAVTTTETPDTTASTDDEQDTSFITKGYFYLYDDRQTSCYVFAFDGKGRVELAQFDDSNIVEEDPEYFTGYTDYKLDGDTILIKKMPKTMHISSVTLRIRDGKLYDGTMELEAHKDLKLSYALKHFS